MKKNIVPFLMLLTGLTIVGCGNSDVETNDVGNSNAVKEEKIVNEVEARKAEDKEETTDPEVQYTYEDFQGAYALYEGEPYESAIVYALILTDDQYIDIVPEWMEYTVFQVEATEIEGETLTLTYGSDVNEMQEADTGTLALELEAEKQSLQVSGKDVYLHPVTQEDLEAQGIQLPADFFQ